MLCRILFCVEVALFAFFAAGTYGLIVPLKVPTSTDFVSFYAAGTLVNEGTPFLAYDEHAHRAAEERARQPGIVYNFFYYPPPFLLVCAALARLPYIPAFIAFATITLTSYVVVIRRILGERNGRVLLPIMAFPPVLWTVGFGQNGLLTASLFGAATLIVDRRPVWAGLLFGALACKPHLALLVPVALAAGGRWRCVTAAAGCAAGLCLLSLAVLGGRTWHDFLTAAAVSGQVYGSGRIAFAGFITPFGAAMLLGAQPGAAVFLQGFATALMAGFVAVVWRRNLALPLRAASLVSATLVAVPVALFYDLVLTGIAGAWLLRADDQYSASAPMKLSLAVLYVLCLNPRGVAAAVHVPLGFMIALALTALIAAAAQRQASESKTGSRDTMTAPLSVPRGRPQSGSPICG